MSPDELKAHWGTFIVAPLTTGGHPDQFRVACMFQGKDGPIVSEHLRAVDRERALRAYWVTGSHRHENTITNTNPNTNFSRL
ncbi:type II toxin-antitoxin system PemK/MazF family toxin [Synechococcus sp. CS-205]|uniref:type II toxin-antitoxin system PemK/MazF family toxin n=1 Tax=Synechococcus sp. CS-205 TaxID=2847984 RepID=UPI0037D99B29